MFTSIAATAIVRSPSQFPKPFAGSDGLIEIQGLWFAGNRSLS